MIGHTSSPLVFLLLLCGLFGSIANAQQSVQLFTENFNVGGTSFQLNTGELGANSGNNKWIINSEYDGQGVYPNTTNQDSTFTGTITAAPNSAYLHIHDEAALPVANASYNNTDPSDRFVSMTNGICTAGLEGITFAFFYICEGTASAYGEVYYSANSGSWTKTGLAQYNGKSKWKYEVITDPAFDNVENLRFAFRWVNGNNTGPDSIAFGVDDIQVIGTYDNVNNPVDITITSVPASVCKGTNLIFGYAMSDTLCDATYEIELSNSSGNFINATGWVLNINYPQTVGTIAITIPSNTASGTCYKVRINRVSPPPQITGIASICFEVTSCPNTITTLQPSVTMDPNGVCIGSVIDVPFWSTGTFNSSNVYTAQLSDSTGSFASPQTIGTLPTSAAYDPSLVPNPGQVAGLVPTAPEACGYFIRVVSNNPADTGTVWGPFCIKACDIETNQKQDISVCISPTEGDTVDISIDINVWNTLAAYGSTNQFMAEVLDAQSFSQVNLGGLGVVVSDTSTTLTVIVPPLPALAALGISPKLWYMRIVADSSSTPNNVLGTVIRLTIGAPDVNPLVIVPSDTVFCEDDIGFLYIANSNSSSSYQWFWNGTPPLGNPSNSYLYPILSIPGINTFEVQETNFGCVGDISPTVSINVIGKPVVSVTGQTQVCIGDTIAYSLPFSANTFYQWSLVGGMIVDTGNNVVTITLDTIGIALLQVDGLNMCGSNSGIKPIVVKERPQADAVGDTIICQGEQIILSATVSQSNYWWSDGDTIIAYFTNNLPVTPDSTTTYTVTTSNGACEVSDSLTVIVSVPPLGFSGDTNICTGESTVITASGGIGYLWDTGDSTASLSLSPSDTTVYAVTVSDSISCTAVDSITIVVYPLPTVSVTNDIEICLGDNAGLTASGGIGYLWSTGDTASSILVSPNANTIYSVTITDNWCSDNGTVSVNVNELPAAYAGEDTTIFTGNNVELSGSGGVSYSWSPSSGLSCTNCENPVASPANTTTYVLTVTDNNGCSNTDTVTIEVSFVIDIVVPNVFTPNGDGVNDEFVLELESIDEIEWVVFNRWGQKIMEWNELNFSWDGKTQSGNEAPDGVYFYVVKATGMDGKLLQRNGTVTLVR